MRGLEKEEEEEETTSEAEPIPTSTTVMLKRAGYLSMVIVVFVSTPFVLTAVGQVTGGLNWTEVFGEGFRWNTVAGQSFLAGFAAVIILIAVMMYFMLKAFTTTEGAW